MSIMLLTHTHPPFPLGSRSDRTHRFHLLLQMLLVRADAPVPPSNGLVLAYHDIFGDLVEQPVLKVSIAITRAVYTGIKLT